jgi:polar amino acid transport system substrate-binding protein
MNDLSRRRLFRAAGGLAVVGLTAGCTTSVSGSAVPVPHPTPVTPPGPPNNLQKARQAGTVTVMTISDDRPFSYKDPDGNGITGETVEVLKAIFPAIGIPKVSFELIDFAGARQKMLTLAAAGDDTFALFATGALLQAEDCERFDLVPDFRYLIAFGVPKGNPKNIKGLEDILNGTRTIATLTGSILDQQLRTGGVPSSSIKQWPDPVTALKAVSQGQVDCFPFYDVSLRQLLADGALVQGVVATDGVELLSAPPMVSGYQFVKQDDMSIRDAFTAQLSTMQQNGQWLQIASRFGLTQGNAVPPGFSVDQVCH